jgi:WD40 repeat protein/DNA-binding SARP family transcriptional activator/energy-coupling factor transporter ATP-binding protein EcfA2
MEFLILGPIDVRNANGAVALGGIKPKAVLAVLLLHANEPVSAERLALALWGEDAPGGAVKTVQVHVSRLRKALGDPDVIATTPAGYCLRVLPGELDAEHFERLVDDARGALADGRPEDASAVLREALSLWRGPALAELALEPFASAEIARLEEQRLAALELRVDADLAAGRHAEVVGELQRLVSEHPTRERLAGQLMLALYRCGRQSEALEAYAAARRVLVDEMGVEPGPQLRDLHGAILRQDVALDAQRAEAELPSQLDAAGEQPIAGRDDELAWLLEHWEKARAGDGALVTVAGPRGAGKRRLLAEAASTIHRPGIAVLFASGEGPADAVVAAVRRASEAARPTLLVVDAADRAGRGALAELARVTPALSSSPVLVVALAEDALALAHLRAADALELGPLDEDAVRAIATRYAPGTAAAELPAEWLLKASEGVASRVHEAASQWARREAARHVDAVAGRAEAGRAELRSMEAELTGGVVALQETRDREPPRGGGGGEEGPPVVCPFKGLASYDVADARHFFGRERLVAELVARLVGAPLLGVVGPSGSGKSSLLRAGLLPALTAGVLPGSERWPQVLLRPGAHPLSELAAGLAKADGEGRVVLAVDQFEETFTVCEDEDERAEFVSELVKAAEDPAGRWVVVIALRADYYGRCAAYPQLATMLAASNVLVRPMAPDELRRAIERPAQRVGLRIEPELVDALVADVEREPGGLPLMSTALLELWQRRDGRRLRHSAYAQTGGVQGAVARLAESAFAQLDEGQQTVARGVLMRLVGSTDDDAVERRRVALDELEIERDEDVARVVALLTDRRLLTVSAGSVELAHEALLREWPRLRGWIEDDREGLRIQRGLSSAADEWARLGRDEGALYRGTRLGEAVEWRDSRKPVLNKLEREFLAAGEAAHGRERITRRRRIVLAFGLLGIALVAITAVALVSIVNGRRTASRELANRSQAVLANDPATARAIALQAVNRADTREAQNAVRQAILADRATNVIRMSSVVLNYPAVSRDGSLVAVGDENGVLRIADLRRGRVTWTSKGPFQIIAAAFSPDAKHVASVDAGAGAGGEVAITDIAGKRRNVVLQLPAGGVATSVEYDPPGRNLLIAVSDGSTRLVPVDGSEGRTLASHDGTGIARFSHDGRRVLLAGHDGVARVVDLDGRELLALDHGAPVHDIDITTRNGGRIVTAGEDGTLRIWDARTGEPLREIALDLQPLYPARFSADGRRVVTAGGDGIVRVVDVRGGPLIALLRGHRDATFGAGFVGDANDRLFSTGSDGTLRMWSLPKIATLPTQEADSPLEPHIDPDGERVVSGYATGQVRLWDPATGAAPALRPKHEQQAAARYSADGAHILSWSADGSVLLRNADGGGARWIRRPSDSAPVAEAAVDPAGRRVAIFALDARQRVVLQAPDGTHSVSLPRHGDVKSLEFSHDGKHLLSSHGNGIVRTWNARSGAGERKLEDGQAAVLDARYSPDGTHVVTASADGSVRIWNVDGGDPIVLYGHEGPVNAVAFNQAGDRIVSGGKDGSVRVWNSDEGAALVVSQHHEGSVTGVAFGRRRPEGQDILSGADDGILLTACEVCGSFSDVLAEARSRPDVAVAQRRSATGDGG